MTNITTNKKISLALLINKIYYFTFPRNNLYSSSVWSTQLVSESRNRQMDKNYLFKYPANKLHILRVIFLPDIKNLIKTSSSVFD